MPREMQLRRVCPALLVLLITASTTHATPPVLIAAVSRITHGSAGIFDIQLPLTGGTGVECRLLSNGTALVMTFDQPVVSGTAAVTSGTGTAGAPTFAGSTMSVPVTQLTDAEAAILTVSNVKNAGGEILAAGTVPFRTLLGDVNANGLVTGSDVNIIRAAVASGSGVNGATFRCDVNANGSLTGSDVNIVRAQAAQGTNVAGGSTANTAPTISSVANQTAISGQASTPVGFTVGDAESDPSTIAVIVSTSDQVNLPNASIAITGTGTSRSMTITAPAGLTTSTNVTVTLTASDGLATSTPITFTTYVTTPPSVYLATLTPVSGVSSLASGTATLSVSGDQTYASLKYSVSNLAGADSDDAVYSQGNNVLYDVPVGKARGDLQADGSYKWIFTNGTQNTIASILAAIQSNTSYMIIESAAYPSGELQGTFKLINGSQTFTPPAAPPSITINPPTAADASRFLQQAGFGGKGSEISSLSNASAANASTALNDWLTVQFATQIPISPSYSASASPVAGTFSSSSMYQTLYNRTTTAQAPNGYADGYQDDRIHEAWWTNTQTAPDQLRQRIATAYSEIFVVSQIDTLVDDNEGGLATYYDMLADDAFVNFRQLLGDVTLHPAMGEYLNMMNNNWINASTAPNENYAREIMQLFTIGLYMLQPDGTLMLDANGQPIATYGQSTITQFANVFTGWNQNSTPVVFPLLPLPAAGPAVTAASEAGNTVTLTVASTTAYTSGQQAIVSGVAPAGYNGTFQITVADSTHLTYTDSTAGLAAGTAFGVVSGPIVVSNLNSYWQKPMVLSPSNGVYHSQLSKTLLSYTGAATYSGAATPGFIPAMAPQTAASATAELNFALDNIFNHPNVGPFVCKQLIQRLVCSNPSPGYVYRVAQVFNNDGTGVRGNMKAVITAILTDYEARSTTVQSAPGYGHAREPIIRIASILRSLNATSKTGKFLVGKTENAMVQTIFRAPTVFNFFPPNYQQPGAIQQAGLSSPELQIIYATTVINSQNLLYTGFYGNYNADGSPILTGTGFRGDNDGNDVYVDFSAATGSGLLSLAQSGGVGAMVDQVGLLLQGPALDPNMRSQIVNFITSNYTSTDYINQVKAAAYLISSSAQCATQK